MMNIGQTNLALDFSDFFLTVFALAGLRLKHCMRYHHFKNRGGLSSQYLANKFLSYLRPRATGGKEWKQKEQKIAWNLFHDVKKSQVPWHIYP